MNNVYKTEDKTDPRHVLTNSEKLANRHMPLYMRQKRKITTDTIAYGKIQTAYGFKYLSGIELKTQSNRNHNARKYAEQTAIKSYIAINTAIICQCSTWPIHRFAFFSSVSKELPPVLFTQNIYVLFQLQHLAVLVSFCYQKEDIIHV